MKLRFEIEHSSLAILIGEAQNAKSFSDRSWGNASFESICERFYSEFSKKPKLELEKVIEIINGYKIEKKFTFDNFALDYILNNLKTYASVKI